MSAKADAVHNAEGDDALRRVRRVLRVQLERPGLVLSFLLRPGPIYPDTW